MHRRTYLTALACMLLIGIAGCGKSAKQIADEKAAEDAAYKAHTAQIEIEREARIERDARAITAASQAAEAQAAQSAAAAAEAAIEPAGMELVKRRLFDPDSAKFRNVTHGRGNVCGEVNAKNKMGGYVGFKAFIVYQGTAFVTSDEGLDRTLYEELSQTHHC